jgi:hypothetical protein
MGLHYVGRLDLPIDTILKVLKARNNKHVKWRRNLATRCRTHLNRPPPLTPATRHLPVFKLQNSKVLQLVFHWLAIQESSANTSFGINLKAVFDLDSIAVKNGNAREAGFGKKKHCWLVGWWSCQAIKPLACKNKIVQSCLGAKPFGDCTAFFKTGFTSLFAEIRAKELDCDIFKNWTAAH